MERTISEHLFLQIWLQGISLHISALSPRIRLCILFIERSPNDNLPNLRRTGANRVELEKLVTGMPAG
jgi:hypothetical protein